MKWWPFTKKKPAQIKRGYDAAQASRLLASFNQSINSEDADLRNSLVTLRARSRNLAKNNDYVKGALRIIHTNVIGSGISFQSQVRKQRGSKLDQQKNNEIELAWYHWTKPSSCHTGGKLAFQDIETLMLKSLPKNGEAIVRIHRSKFGNSKIPLALEVIAPDLLDETLNREAGNQHNEIKMGVELDSFGRPIAYHFRNRHPGDTSTYSGYASNERVRILARDIIHLFITDEENQTRAAPWMVSGMKRLHHMGGYEEASVVGARARAALMGFIESPEGQVTGDGVEGEQRVYDFEPAVFKQLNPGEKVNVPNIAAPSGELDPFMRIMLRGVAAGIGISYESLSKDYQGATYSSARQALLEDRDLWRVIQQWIIRNFHQRIFEEFMDMAYLSGALDLPLYPVKPEQYLMPKWQPRGWTWIDPLKEVNAYAAAVRSGFMTVADVLSQNGGDFEEYVVNRKRELDMLAEQGIILDTDPAKVSSAGQTNVRPNDKEASNAPKENETEE
jgi:lambda family phage portal protein